MTAGVAGAHRRGLRVAAAAAATAGTRGLFAITPSQPDSAGVSGLAGAAARDGAGGDAAALVAALGAATVEGLDVAYVDCLAGAADPASVAREVAAMTRVARSVTVVEDEGGHGGVAALLAEEGLAPREHRHVTPDGVAVRRFVCDGLATCAERQADAPPLRVAISDHQGKSAGIAAALAAAGHHLVDRADLADVVLIDHDAPFHGKLPLVQACVAAGGRAFLYPHGADSANMTSWDGQYPVCPLLSGALVLAAGHAEIARRYGYPYPVTPVGWTLGPLAPRRLVDPPRRVLFAPTHPPYLGNPRYPGRNAEVFGLLSRLPVEVTVRHIGTLQENGLWEVPGVAYVRGDAPGAPGMVEQIDAADLVVADRSTFGHLAVSRGVAAVLWDSAIVLDNTGERSPAHIGLYREYLRYPFDVDAGGLWGTMLAAARDTAVQAEWRDRFVGPPLDVAALVTALRGA